ncbi:MAG: hypothetical protein JSS35_09215, partial [Proteobacteria bacterium]|nr:hypothetical protein [Pseudomonadota bacterium]
DIQALAAAEQQLETRRAQYAANTLRDLADQQQLTDAELGLVGASVDQRDAEIDRLQRILALKAQGTDLDSDQAKAILAQGAALDATQAKLRAANDNWNELKSAGDRFIDDVLNPQNWTSWGDVAKAAIEDIASELLKLAAINPLKNLLFGESNPTIGSIGAAFSHLFGGGGTDAAVSNVSFTAADFVGFANGTNSAPGGPAWIAENGPELVQLPAGTRVTPADATRKLVSQAAQQLGGGVQINMPITLNAQGAGPREVDELKAQIAELQASLPGQIIATVNDGLQRRQIRAA